MPTPVIFSQLVYIESQKVIIIPGCAILYCETVIFVNNSDQNTMNNISKYRLTSRLGSVLVNVLIPMVQAFNPKKVTIQIQ